VITISNWKFFLISGIFPTCFGFPCLQMQRSENSWNFRSFTKQYLWSIQSLKIIGLKREPVAFETGLSKMTCQNINTIISTLRKWWNFFLDFIIMGHSDFRWDVRTTVL